MKRPFVYAAIITTVAVALIVVISTVIRLMEWPPNLISGLQSRNYSKRPLTQLSIFYDLNRGKGAARQSNHLYILSVCANAPADGSLSSELHLSERPSYYRYSHQRWKTDIGMIELPIRWHYWNDTIDVGEQTFERSKGNVFVALRQSDGEWDTVQCGTLGDSADYDEAARHILKNYSGHLPKLEWSE